MGVNVPDREYLAVRGVTTALSTVNSFMLLVQTEASIYTVMVDPRDAAVVLSALSRGCYSLRRMVESAVESANSSLPRITSTAVVQEITKARDLVGEIGDSRLCKLVPAYKP